MPRTTHRREPHPAGGAHPRPAVGGWLRLAGPSDAADIAGLRTSVAQDLTAKFGHGPWSAGASERSVFANPGRSRTFGAWQSDRLMASLTLATKKPWAIDVAYFTPCETPLYLHSMAVDPTVQRTGVGRRCLEEVVRICRDWPAGAIRLDAYDAEAGAGGFYRRCGYTEVGRVVYRRTPLVYYELVL